MATIYKILNTLTDDCYIGSSLKFRNRKSRHLSDLRAGVHHSIILQRAVNKYGIENFIFQEMEQCPDDIILEREQWWMDSLKPIYNISKTAGNCIGAKHTPESSEKKRQYALANGIRPPEETWKDRQKKVYQLNYNTLEVLNEFQSLAEACRAMGKDATYATTIAACCNNKRYSAFKYRWVFNLEDIPNLRTKKSLNERPQCKKK